MVDTISIDHATAVAVKAARGWVNHLRDDESAVSRNKKRVIVDISIGRSQLNRANLVGRIEAVQVGSSKEFDNGRRNLHL
jgi:hypothetical protein